MTKVIGAVDALGHVIAVCGPYGLGDAFEEGGDDEGLLAGPVLGNGDGVVRIFWFSHGVLDCLGDGYVVYGLSFTFCGTAFFGCRRLEDVQEELFVQLGQLALAGFA